jgi:uncharacterized membrane protein
MRSTALAKRFEEHHNHQYALGKWKFVPLFLLATQMNCSHLLTQPVTDINNNTNSLGVGCILNIVPQRWVFRTNLEDSLRNPLYYQETFIQKTTAP